MTTFNTIPLKTVDVKGKEVYCFSISDNNIDTKTVHSFGEEWSKFDTFSEAEIKQVGDDYFDIVLNEMIANKNVLDMGCGTGRWTKYVSRHAGHIHAVDPSEAIFVAARMLRNNENVTLSKAAVDHLPFDDNSFDLVFSLGVLHHIPDTLQAMKKCVAKVKPGGYFLVYLYYNLDNRGKLFKTIFRLSNSIRVPIAKLPGKPKRLICDFLAVSVYMPFVITTRFLKSLGLKNISKKVPLSYYADKSFNIIRNDALDRFGTPLEQRFSKEEIKSMMESCGLVNILFSNTEPYWHAIGKKI